MRGRRAIIGITASAVDSKAVFDSDEGVIRIEESVAIYEVSDGSVADGILQAGDILVSAEINGNISLITRQYHIIDMMLDVRVGDVLTLTILRNGEEKTVSIVIQEECLTEY